jgi:GTPase SAR1 family protein
MEICRLCGNPYKDENTICTFCTGEQRRLFGVDWGWMYQKEFDGFQRIAYLFSIPTMALAKFVRRKARDVAVMNPLNQFSTVGVWGTRGSGKTWLIQAFLQSVTLLKKENLAFSLKEGQLLPKDVIGTEFAGDTVLNPFPIQPTMGLMERRYYFLRKKFRLEHRDNAPKAGLFGVNSHIHELFIYDDMGGKLEDPPSYQGRSDLVEDYRQKIADSNYIVILINKTDDMPAMYGGLSDLIKRIQKQDKENKPIKRISICLNKIEDFIKAYRNDTEKLQERTFFTEKVKEVFPHNSADYLLGKFSELEKLLSCEIRYFVISSCGYTSLLRKKASINLDKSGQSPCEPNDWIPVNVFSVFSWFFEEIEQARIRCDNDDVFTRFENLPEGFEEFLQRLHLYAGNTQKKRLKDYIPYNS